MPKPLTDLERLFKALADTTRLRILGLLLAARGERLGATPAVHHGLLAGEVCVCHIHESLRIPQPRASRHLAYLRRAGLVAARKEGLWVHYRLTDAPDPVMAAIREAVIQALGPIDAVRKDADRLYRKTGCCVPVERPVPLTADRVAPMPVATPPADGL
ncbi:MAG: hypothetical protein A3H97_13140 [Acidobacteria bacterium RIFCSPLOWO2_02_FULL_65_29]|nr:MAG: hypothetical protein A3H97_13140 [Acidobacteria bacterium RIFCSPLOWO2_02_FULL_65_29]